MAKWDGKHDVAALADQPVAAILRRAEYGRAAPQYGERLGDVTRRHIRNVAADQHGRPRRQARECLRHARAEIAGALSDHAHAARQPAPAPKRAMRERIGRDGEPYLPRALSSAPVKRLT